MLRQGRVWALLTASFCPSGLVRASSKYSKYALVRAVRICSPTRSVCCQRCRPATAPSPLTAHRRRCTGCTRNPSPDPDTYPDPNPNPNPNPNPDPNPDQVHWVHASTMLLLVVQGLESQFGRLQLLGLYAAAGLCAALLSVLGQLAFRRAAEVLA